MRRLSLSCFTIHLQITLACKSLKYGFDAFSLEYFLPKCRFGAKVSTLAGAGTTKHGSFPIQNGPKLTDLDSSFVCLSDAL